MSFQLLLRLHVTGRGPENGQRKLYAQNASAFVGIMWASVGMLCGELAVCHKHEHNFQAHYLPFAVSVKGTEA